MATLQVSACPSLPSPPASSTSTPPAAKKAAQKGPVFITDRGRASHVLLTIDEYHQIAARSKSAGSQSIGDLLACPAAAEIDFDPPRFGTIAQAVDLD